jgi:hypothetical protein
MYNNYESINNNNNIKKRIFKIIDINLIYLFLKKKIIYNKNLTYG